MNVKKTLLLVSAIFLCAGAFAAGKIRIAPGASCYAWNVNTKSKPDTVPVGGFVDEAEEFWGKNIYQCAELKNIAKTGFIMWEGYLRVPKTGQYRFSFNVRGGYNNNIGAAANTKIFLNSKNLLTRATKDERALTASAYLKQGFVKIRIYFNPTKDLYYTGFSLKFAPNNAMKMTEITPATLYHKVEDED